MSEQLTQQPANELLGRRVSFGKTTTLAGSNGAANAAAADFAQSGAFAGMGITRERSFVRMPSMNQQHQQHQHQSNKRRSLAFGHPHQHAMQQQQMRGGKPALELYRPPSECCVGDGDGQRLWSEDSLSIMQWENNYVSLYKGKMTLKLSL